MPVKVAYIQPNSEIGGSDICLLRMLQALDRERFEPLVLLPRDGPLVPAFEKAGARVRFVEMAQLRTKLSVPYQSRYLAHFWPTVRNLTQVIEEESADIVHTNSLYCLYGPFAARASKRPHVWHIREIPPRVPVGREGLAELVEHMATRIVSMTRACEQSLFGRQQPPHASVLYEGISLSEFHPGVSGDCVRASLGLDAKAPLIGFVARLDPWKGLHLFLRSAALVRKRFPEAHFLIAGDAPKGFESYAAEMKRLALDLGLEKVAHFVGFRHGAEDMPQVMASLTLLNHTAVRPEPFGLVLIEAMAMSRPVVSTRMGGPLEIIVDGETGLLTAPRDSEANAEAVCRLLSDREALDRMGRAARCRVEERFRVSDFRDNLTGVYEQARAARAYGA